MKPRAFFFLIGVIGLVFPALLPAEAAPLMRIGVDKTRVYKLPEPAGGIVIGNPAIVSVAMHDTRTLLLTGKVYGSTQMTVLDNNGSIMRQLDLAVTRNNAREVTIVRPGEEEDLICIGKCRKLNPSKLKP